MNAPYQTPKQHSEQWEPGVPPRALFKFHPFMVADALRQATPVRRMTIGETFLAEHVRVWAPDLYTFPLLSPEFCRFLIQASDALGTWGPEKGDDFGAPELRLHKITPRLADVVEELMKRHVNPLLRRLFMGGYEVGHIKPPFLIRYDMATQQSMEVHFDGQSDLSLAVALNREFEGGNLSFPRQGVVVDELPIGHAVLFPGGPTHLHQALPITSGTRRSLTIWTKSGKRGD